jgi:hypothetical protein
MQVGAADDLIVIRKANNITHKIVGGLIIEL